MAFRPLRNKRSVTGNHPLLPASRPGVAFEPIPRVPTYTLITWTFGRGSVIWRIWPAVLLHTIFAAVVVTLSVQKIVDLEIPSVMLTVLGVVIGFVISYRAMSGYERYWLGRGYWSDIIRNSRSLGRLIWFHVPPRLTAKTPEEIQAGSLQRSMEELNKVMAEKRMALDLITGFSIAVKHHLRGELGIYFEDLYHLIRPLHDHDHSADDHVLQQAMTSALPSPRRGARITTQTNLPSSIPISVPASLPKSTAASYASRSPSPSPLHYNDHDVHERYEPDPVILPINAYGTFDPSQQASSAHLRKSPSRASHLSSISTLSQHRPLLPSAQPPPGAEDVMGKVSKDLIMFAGTWSMIKSWFSRRRPAEDWSPRNGTGISEVEEPVENDPFTVQRKWQGPVYAGLHMKHHPKVAGGGENLPLEIVRCLSEWFSVLEDRGTVAGTSLGGMIGTLAAFEDSLTGLERILTTPLPFVYSVHISTVWVYLFFLPFQLVTQFQYYTIPGVAIAAFIYLGFVAAGEEIEQPFGYDDNDLDLDLFCQGIVRTDIKHLKTSPALNAYLGPLQEHPQTVHRRSLTLHEITNAQDNALLSPVTVAASLS